MGEIVKCRCFGECCKQCFQGRSRWYYWSNRGYFCKETGKLPRDSARCAHTVGRFVTAVRLRVVLAGVLLLP